MYVYVDENTIYDIYIYIYTWKTIKTKVSVRTGLDIFFVRYVFFSKYGHVRLQTLYLQVNLVNSWICRTGSDSMSVSSRDSIWGSMLTFAYCFFFNMMLKKYWYFMGTSKFGGKYGSICGQIWVPDHDSQFAPLWTEIPLLETVEGCPNTVLSKDLNNPSQSKTKIRNWTKKTSVTGKTHNRQTKMSIRFSRYIYIYYNYIIMLYTYFFTDMI